MSSINYAAILARCPAREAKSIAAFLVSGYAGGPAIQRAGSRAFYRLGTDSVQLPKLTRFESTQDYYSTLFHELAHSTGHRSRLDRGIDTAPEPFGSPDYGREEQCAEMAASFLTAHAGIHPCVIENQSAYIGGWLKQIRQDKRLVITAAGAAQRAADWILGERTTVDPRPDEAP